MTLTVQNATPQEGVGHGARRHDSNSGQRERVGEGSLGITPTNSSSRADLYRPRGVVSGGGRLTPDPTKCFLYKVFGGRGVHIRSRKERRRRCLAVLATSETKVSPLAVARRLHTFTPTTGDRSGGRGSTDSTQRDRHAPRTSAPSNHHLRSFLGNHQATAAKP